MLSACDWSFVFIYALRLCQPRFGVQINDLDGLHGLGIDPKAVAKILVETFAAMVFCIGYVHGDPHPGNVMVRRDSKGAPQVCSSGGNGV